MESNLPPSQSIQDETKSLLNQPRLAYANERKKRTPMDDPTTLEGVARSSPMNWLQFLIAPTLPAFDTVPPPPSENADAREIDDVVDSNKFAEWDSLPLSGSFAKIEYGLSTDDLLSLCNADDTRAAIPNAEVPYADNRALFGQGVSYFGQGGLVNISTSAGSVSAVGREDTDNDEDDEDVDDNRSVATEATLGLPLWHWLAQQGEMRRTTLCNADTEENSIRNHEPNLDVNDTGVSVNNSTTNNESKLDVNETRAATPNSQVPYADTDVLFGQGGLVNTHPGNRRFRSLAGEFRQRYNTTSSREEKRQLVQRFVANVQENGARFWAKDESRTYVEVDVDNEFYTNKFQQLIRADPVVERAKAKQRAENRRARERLP